VSHREKRFARASSRVVAAAAGVLLLATGAAACSDTPPRVTLYGDSLGFESKDELADQLRGEAGLTPVTQGGAALCDALPQMTQDLDRRKPNLALIQFSGNNITDCMHQADGTALEGAALIDKYASDAEQAVSILRGRGVAVYFVGSPIAESSSVPASINAEYQKIAQRWSNRGEPVFYVDAGAAVLAPDGQFTSMLPCLPTETAGMGCTDGQIIVRAPDGIHFCPALSGGTTPCPVYSSGAHRFAAAMAEPVLERVNEGLFGNL
jgi:hypothetical protein